MFFFIWYADLQVEVFAKSYMTALYLFIYDWLIDDHAVKPVEFVISTVGTGSNIRTQPFNQWQHLIAHA